MRVSLKVLKCNVLELLAIQNICIPMICLLNAHTTRGYIKLVVFGELGMNVGLVVAVHGLDLAVQKDNIKDFNYHISPIFALIEVNLIYKIKYN